MSVYKDKRTNSWCYKFIYSGVQYHRCFKGATKDEVIGFECIAKSELRKSNYDIASDRHNYTLSQIIAEYKEYRANNYARPEEFDYVINKFYSLIGNKIAEQITLADLEKYRTFRKGKVKNSTINREMDNIKRIFSLALKNKRIRYNPCSELDKLKIENPNKRFLTKQEEIKLLKAANPIMRTMIILALNSGMRVSEILNLKWEHIFFQQNYLVALNPKNGKPRKILLNKMLKNELKKFPKISEYVFTNPLTKTKYKNIKKTFSRTVERAGIPHITFHELRHTTASRLNEKGVDILTIKEILDHADLKTTQQYMHTPRKNILDAVNVLESY
ncbi:MAG TPA: site-specific integrase [Candidatus Gastranaerophilales bacterium]|nr:site-specific integrase [Candidatus Gastranaerophilales bacterium]